MCEGIVIRTTRLAFLTAVICAMPYLAGAQAVSDPQAVEFDPSPQHSAVDGSGAALVTRYDLSVYNPGGSTPLRTVSLGKPSPGGDGKIRVAFLALMTPPLATGVMYEAKIITVGPGGSTPSTASNGFTFSAPCSYSVSPVSASVPAAGGSLAFTVTAAAGCAWSASSPASWVPVSGGASGSGNGSATFSAASNGSTSNRTTTLTIAGVSVSVNQAGITCSYALAPASAAAPVGGGSGSFSMAAPTGCSWSGSSSASWLSISGGSGSGNGTIGYSATANGGTSQRSATITAGGQTVTVTQPGVSCSYTLSPASASLAAGASSGAVAMAAPAGCGWAASSNASWLTVTGGTSGSGSGTIAFSAAANASAAPRSASIAAGGQTLTVTQSGTACSYAVSPTSRNVSAPATTGTMSVTAPDSCAWTAVSDAPWLTIQGPAGGSGSGAVSYSVAANPTVGATRTAALTVSGATLTIVQAAATCTYVLGPASTSLAPTASTGQVTLSTADGCSWTASSSASWLTITSPTSGSGNAGLSFSATANTSLTARSATISAGGKSVIVSQAVPTTCTYTPTPDAVTLARDAQEGSVTVDVSGGCPLSATSTASWLTVNGIDAATSSVRYAVAANDTGADRSAALRVGTKDVMINQKAKGAPGAPKGVSVKGKGRDK